MIVVALALGSAFGQNTATAPSTAADDQFTLQSVDQVLSALRAGFLRHDFKRTLALFDGEHMPSYDEFANRLRVIFDQYVSFRVRYHILQSVDESKVAVVDFTLEGLPLSSPSVPSSLPSVRRSERLRVNFGRVGKEWKITDVQPRGFFSSFGD